MTVDPIADFLTRIRNGAQMQHAQIAMPSSRIKVDMARILQETGFIQGFEVVREGHRTELVLTLKYDRHGRSVISGLKRISKRGRRVYVGWRDIRWVRSGLGLRILTTPQGLMTGQAARQAKLGGEVLCEVW